MARNSDVSPYIGKLSRSKLFAKKGLYKREHKAAPAAAEAAPATKEVTVGGKANGEKRTVSTDRAPAFYPSEDVKLPKASRKTVKPTKIRASITKGTVLILLAGRFRGKVRIPLPPFPPLHRAPVANLFLAHSKRVVTLGTLPSGLLLVTGPFKGRSSLFFVTSETED